MKVHIVAADEDQVDLLQLLQEMTTLQPARLAVFVPWGTWETSSVTVRAPSQFRLLF